MATRRIIDIGIEGNDGTGDSIRESFRKTNENFREIYAIFGEGGRIGFTTLGDTPDVLIPQTVPFVDAEGTKLDLLEFASNSALDPDASDTVVFDYSVPGKIIASTGFTKLEDDTGPTLGGPLNVRGNSIGNVAISQQAVIDFNNEHDTDLSIDDLVITKGFADRRYITSGLPIRVAEEPETTSQYVVDIDDYTNGNLQINSHGFDRAANGTAFIFRARFDDPNNLTSGETYFIRFVNPDQIALFTNQEDARIIDDTTALGLKIFVTGGIGSGDRHFLTDAGFDPSLEGNFLANVAIPRKSAVRRQGDSMEGALFLDDHPGDLAGFGTVNGADDLQAATKFYVDNISFTSQVNLFVSTSGDDRMTGVPKGREGTAIDFAFRTVNAAAQKAEEIIKSSDSEPGPYFQTVTTDEGDLESSITKAEIVSPVFSQTRKLIDLNKDYLEKEYVGYIKSVYPDFVFDSDDYENDIRNILDAISFDVNRGANANILTRNVAESFYSTTQSRFKIRTAEEEILDGLDFVKEAVNTILQNKLFRERDVESITVDGGRAAVTTSQDHSLTTGEQVVFKDMGGMTDIEDQTAYVRVLGSREFELYRDEELENLFDISSYDSYTTGGRIGVVYQDRISGFDSVKLLQVFDEPDADATGRSAVSAKFDLASQIISEGVGAGPDIVFGSNYKIVLDNGGQSFVDQADPANLDMIPGKIIVGKRSGARGRIVNLVSNDGTENNNDTFELIQLNGKDFIEGETVEYGNFVKNKQITIHVESGIYEEDLPIKLSNNVSLKGDEFRRVIIRPKRRVSQSPWANMYFYRDLEFDDIQLLDILHSKANRIGFVGSDIIEVDNTEWMTVGQEVRFVGAQLIGTELEKNTVYFITSIDNNEITVSETENGSNVTFATDTGTMFVVDSEVSPFLNQTNQIQGYFGRFYLDNPYRDINIGIPPTNPGGFDTASQVLQRNRTYIQNEIIDYIETNIQDAEDANDTDSIWFDFSYDSNKCFRDIGLIVDALSRDLELGRSEFTLETQGEYYEGSVSGQEQQTKDAIERITFFTSQLLAGNNPPQNTDIRPDTSLGAAESETPSLVGELIDLITFAFDDDYNPPKRNDGDGVDVFMMGDATIIRNATVQGHGGFMVVLDPESQILSKSPYIQTGSSFSKSDNEKRFRGGMYVDAYTGNIPARIVNVTNPFRLDLESDSEQGLAIRPPELPAPFFLDGIRYQVNAISDYDGGEGTVTIFLDQSSNPDGSGIGQGYQGTTPQEIFIQTAGNRSMLGNDFTQINDLGYGLVTNNGAFSEMVSMFTYYCQAAYYANNGSEIRSLNGSNGYGNFGLVAEGADPNEIPDQVTLAIPMSQPCKSFVNSDFQNAEEDQFITVYDLKDTPTIESILTIDHGSSIGVLNYRITAIQNLSDSDLDGNIGDTSGDVVATGGVESNAVYRLGISADDAIQDDFFASLQASVPNDALLTITNARQQVFAGVRSQQDLESRPSTAVNFDESDATTYRSLDFSTSDVTSQPLESDEILAVLEQDFQFILLEIDPDNLSGGFGGSQGDDQIAILPIANQDTITRLLRDTAGRQPGDGGYTGGMIFTYAGKTHQIINYNEQAGFGFIQIQDFDNVNINTSYNGSGLAEAIPARERVFRAGLPNDATAEITIAISLLRATGHDFTQIGAGGFNDSNYPNVIYGRPINPFAPAYTDAATASSAQIWERRKGRVFFVTTDQDGFFRVGKFFSVDQATGSVEFAGDIGLTGANALGFKRGVTINEFSADDSFADVSATAVPTERAISGYINRVLGINLQNSSFPSIDASGNRIGPGFVALNGRNAMEADLDLGQNQITNLALPGSDGGAAANKNYVDNRAKAYDELDDLRNIELNDVAGADLLIGTGKKRIFVIPEQGGTFTVGDSIGIAGGSKTGEIVDIETYNDDIEGNLRIITYTETSPQSFDISETVLDQPDESISATIVDGPVDEFANAAESSSSVINLSVTRDENGAEYNLQIEDGSIVNADVNSDAEISQSKLDLQNADTFDEDDSTVGWNGTQTKTQSDLGVAKFSDENFDTKDGYVRIKAGGIVFAEMNQIDQYELFGRTDENVGDASAISFSDVIEFGNGLEDKDFDNTVITTDANFPGKALVKLGDGAYGVTNISTGIGSDTIARRDSAGKLDANAIKVGGNDILTTPSTGTIRFSTPGNATIISAAGNNSDSVVVKLPGNLDIGETARSNQSDFQSGSSFSDEGWLAGDWIYTSFIEAGGEGDINSTGIGLGANTGFSRAGEGVLDFITGGVERFVIKDTATRSINDFIAESSVILGQDNQDLVTFTASVNSNIIPDQNGVRNIGSNSQRWDVMYANIFDGVATEAKYADLAEKYTADADYEAGTVVVFGGEQEVTVTDAKGDRRVAGVVSTNPAYLMNSELTDDAVAVALQGRVPCKVLGKVTKGDLLVTSAIPGYAVVNNDPKIGTVLGKALENKEQDAKGVIEIVVGRT